MKKFLCVALHCLCVAITVAPAMGATVEILQTTNISSKITAIGGLPKSVHIQGVSGDGSVVVGIFRSNQVPHGWQIFRYTRATGIENLGTMGRTLGINGISEICVSADGLVIAGTFYIENDGSHIFRYTQSNGLQDLGTMGRKVLAVSGVSADGLVIVGSFIFSLTPETRFHAFKYSESQGFEDLGTMGAESAFAHGVSADGSFIVGNFHVPNGGDHAFRYSQSNGVQDLGAVGGRTAYATGISDDGSVMAGLYFGGFSFFWFSYYNRVFIYTETDGVQKLGAMSGKSARAHSVSADGTKFNGSYIDYSDESYAFTAKIVFPVTQENK
jgi:probable HAF family extracellular repeat protein